MQIAVKTRPSVLPRRLFWDLWSAGESVESQALDWRWVFFLFFFIGQQLLWKLNKELIIKRTYTLINYFSVQSWCCVARWQPGPRGTNNWDYIFYSIINENFLNKKKLINENNSCSYYYHYYFWNDSKITPLRLVLYYMFWWQSIPYQIRIHAVLHPMCKRIWRYYYGKISKYLRV